MSDCKRLRLVLASGNRHKCEELTKLFLPYGVELVLGSSLFVDLGEIEETGSTYEENALIKARAWANAVNMPALADDSGVEVKALGWEPGVRSARYAPGSDEDRVEALLRALRGVTDRAARFVASLVIVFPEAAGAPSKKNYFSALGVCDGKIILAPQGEAGFGYDPVFVPDGYDRSFAELGDEVKSKISHRAIASAGLAQMIPAVIQYQTVCREDFSTGGHKSDQGDSMSPDSEV